MNASAIDFSDLDDLGPEPSAPARKEVPTIPCPKCAGTGRFTFGFVNIRTGECRQCKGTGRVRADWQKRREAFKKGEATKAQRLADRAAQWKADHPAAWGWLEGQMRSRNEPGDFVRSLYDAVGTYGRLTDRQLECVERSIVKDAEFKTKREAEAVARSVNVAGDGANKLVAALNHAKVHGNGGKGMKRQPTMIVGDVDFSRAPDHGKNPGCVYVKTRSSDLYLGKISAEGLFMPSRECDEALKAKIATIMLDPLAAAIEHGKLTGECSCCGRKLTDPVSVANGIGPVCAEGFGF